MEEISMYWGAHLKGWHFFFSLFVFIGLPVATPAQPGKTQDPPQIVYLFSSSTCPHCRALKTSLDHLLVEQHNWQIKEFVLDQDPLAREELIRHKQRLNLPLSSVPITVIDNKYWVGFSPQIVERIGHIIKGDPKENHIDSAFEIPWIGRLNLEDNNIWINTILIAAVDGFNPCSLWVLTLLIGIVIGTKSRKKIAVIGVSFLLVTAFVYGLFIAGVVSVLNYLDFVPWVRTAIALFALFFGLVNVKDYFWYKQGISFTIPKKLQPLIYRRFKKLSLSDASLLQLSALSALLALGIAIIEMPCTAGFPVIWAQLLTRQNISGEYYLLLLLTYVLVYLIDELILFFLLVYSLQGRFLQESHGRGLKLVSGLIMSFIALSLNLPACAVGVELTIIKAAY